MKIKILQSPLDKGEKWEKASKREIEVTPSSDKGKMKTVYFGIATGKRIKADLFLSPLKARQIACMLLRTADKVEQTLKK